MVSRPVFFFRSRVIQLFQKFFIWPIGKGQFAIVVLWKEKICVLVTSFLGFAKNKNKGILRFGTRRIQNYICDSGLRVVVVTGYAASCLLKGP